MVKKKIGRDSIPFISKILKIILIETKKEMDVISVRNVKLFECKRCNLC